LELQALTFYQVICKQKGFLFPIFGDKAIWEKLELNLDPQKPFPLQQKKTCKKKTLVLHV
jgi:hypothetical protein